jgi:hypothetical protein
MAREKFKAAFFDRYLAPLDTAPAPMAAGPTDGYVGKFRPIRMNYTDIDKLVYLLALSPISVDALDGGRLLVSGSLTPDWVPTQFEPVGPALFRQVGGDRLIAFRVDGSGHATHFLSDPTVAAERVPWNESPSFWYPVLALALLVMVSVLIDAAYRRGDPSTQPTRRLAALTGAWPFLTLLAAGVVVGVYRMSILERIPVALKVVLAMPVIFLGLTALLAAAALKSWRRPIGTGRRIHLTIAALAAISLCWFCWQWNILGWQFG